MVCMSSCCFLWDTKAGCVAIGYLTGGLSFACCVGSIMRLFMGLPLILQNDDYQGEFPFNPLFYVFSAVYFAFHTVTSFGLVPAVKEGQTMFVVPSIVLLCADTILSGVAIVVIGTKLVKYSDEFLIGGLGLAVILMTLLAYSTLVVISHLEEMFQLDQIPLQKPKWSSRETPSSDITESSDSHGTVV